MTIKAWLGGVVELEKAAIRPWVRAAVASLLIAAAAAPAGERYPPRSVLLFVASWCAPCHAEIGRIDAITTAAAPYRVLVVPIDAGRATDAMMRRVPVGQRWTPGAVRIAEIRADLFGDTAGLPFSVAIGRDGRRCAATHGGLGPARAAAMVAGCE